MAHSDVHTLNLRTWDTFHGIRYFANIIKVIDLETENTLDYSGRPSSIIHLVFVLHTSWQELFM